MFSACNHRFHMSTMIQIRNMRDNLGGRLKVRAVLAEALHAPQLMRDCLLVSAARYHAIIQLV
jgi:hypothetical protein